MNAVNKICTCFCCWENACGTACCIDYWHSWEAQGLSALECQACCWSICAPICHSCELGNTSEGLGHCINCLKYCLYSWALYCCSPCDACYNCIFYVKDICTEGVTGHHNIMKNTRFISSKLRNAFDFAEGQQPAAKYMEFRP